MLTQNKETVEEGASAQESDSKIQEKSPFTDENPNTKDEKVIELNPPNDQKQQLLSEIFCTKHVNSVNSMNECIKLNFIQKMKAAKY